MLRYGLILVVSWALSLSSSATAWAEKRMALVIGNSSYVNTASLPNPVSDASAVAALFRAAGFEVVEERRDVGNLDFKRAVREFTSLARNADIAVIYFAGHGIEINGTNYLVPTDAKLASDFDAEDEAVSLDRIVRALEPVKRLRLVILDACRDNPFIRTMQRTVALRAVPAGLAKVEPASPDTLIAFAAKAGSTAEDGRGVNSPFTSALIKHLAVPGLDVRLAFGRVRDEVIKTTGSRQEPFVYGSLGGATVALVPEPPQKLSEKISILPAPQPIAVNPVADVRRDYELAERVGTKTAWDSFLAVHETGFYAELARSQLAKLATNLERSPASPVPDPPQANAGQSRVVTVVPADNAPTDKPKIDPGPDPVTIARLLQTELKRVGCDPGEADGQWSGKSRRALALFNQHARVKTETKVASLGALDVVRSKAERICPLVCDRGFMPRGDGCVAIEKKPVERVAKPAPEPRERRRVIEAPARPVSVRPASGAAERPLNPLCQSYFTQGGAKCCTYDPPHGPPRIICN